MRSQHVVVARRLVFELLAPDGPTVSVRVELSYDARDPFAVRAMFATGGKPVTWLLGRELLHAGLTGPAGHGDVHVQPIGGAPPRVLLSLSSSSGRAGFRVGARELGGFLRETYRLVPRGAEYADAGVDVDAELLALLDGGDR